jgi:hypothetical protein
MLVRMDGKIPNKQAVLRDLDKIPVRVSYWYPLDSLDGALIANSGYQPRLLLTMEETTTTSFVGFLSGRTAPSQFKPRDTFQKAGANDVANRPEY